VLWTRRFSASLLSRYLFKQTVNGHRLSGSIFDGCTGFFELYYYSRTPHKQPIPPDGIGHGFRKANLAVNFGVGAENAYISKLTKKFPAYVTFPGFFTFHAKFGKSESRLP